MTLLGGRYRLEGLLGRGGMGEVYRAIDTADDQAVAIKVLPAEAGRHHADRLRREAGIAASLHDPHIVEVLDTGTDSGDSRLYVAMRLVEGADLKRVLGGAPMTPPRALALLTQVAQALDTAHTAGIVHRDVKPSNILVGPDEDAHLTDFGIARPLDPEATRMTVTGGYVGSLDYIAPEQLRGLDVTGAADVYSLACVLYECLTGHVPFPAADPAAKLAAQLNSVPAAPSTYQPAVPPALDLVVATGMDKDPRRRYATAGQLMAAAHAALRQAEDRTTPAVALPHGDPAQPGQQVIMRAIVTTAARRGGDPTTPADQSGGVCPYPGLRSFGTGDADWFFGRDGETSDLLVRLSGQLGTGGPLVVVGASGSGKSSLLVAGLLPALDTAAHDLGRSRWPRVVLTPGDRPVDTLAARLAGVVQVDPGALAATIRHDPARFGQQVRAAAEHAARDGARPVIVVDQFEQLFTDGAGGPERVAFATALAHAWPALVIVAVRADYVPDCIALEPLRTALDSPFVVGPLGAAALREVITLPAARAGLVLEDGLADRLIGDVGARDGSGFAQGALPRLAHALRATWRNRWGNVLTLRGYQATGGVDRAVAVTADQLYGRLHPHHQDVLRATLLRLVRVLPDGGLTRRTAARGELDERAVTGLVDARLVTADDDGVRLAHDALLTAWPRLRAWVDVERQDLLLRQRLDESAANWVESGRDRGDLYRGARLAAALDWAAHHPPTQPQQEFLRASEREQRRGTRRLRTAIAALAVLLVASLVASVVAYYQTEVADDRLAEAESRRLATLAEQAADTWPRQSQLLAAAAWRRAPTRQAREALLATENQRLDTMLSGHEGPVQSVAFSPDGDRLVSGGIDGTIRVWDMATREGRVLFEPGEAVNAVEFSPDGRRLAVGSTDESLYLLDAETGEVRERIEHGAPVVAVAFSPDGRTVVSSHGTPQLWDVGSGRRLGRPLAGHDDIVTSVLFTADGERILTSGPDGTIRVWNAATQEQVRTITTASPCLFLAYDPEFEQVACRDGIAIGRFDIATGDRVGEALTGHNNTIQDLAFGKNGHVLASTSEDRTVRLWYLATGQQIGEPMRASDDDTFGVAFSPDDRVLAVASGDGNIVLWRTSLPAASGRAAYSDLSRDGTVVAFGDTEGTVTTFDTATSEATGPTMRCDNGAVGPLAVAPDGERIAVPCGEGLEIRTVGGDEVATYPDVTAIAVTWSPDGDTLAVSTDRAAKSSALLLVDADSGDQRELWETGDDTKAVWSLAFSPGGDRLATGTLHGRIMLWDTASGDRIGEEMTGHIDTVQDIAFQPHGRLLATSGWDNTVRLWDPDKGEQVGPALTEHTDRPITVSFSPDGTRLASAGWDGTPLIWDVADHTVQAALREPGDIQAIRFLPDGTLVGTGAGGLIATWDADPEKALADVCARLDPLDDDEWRQFAPDVDFVPQC
ncbi:protein kinase [Actinophytocola sp. NPDC049390]|uniref:nSTAND1 domain-containing NTPase n=1 Tax=Actinophytocola sp. NPDC049390 TaxID=3363894 RepID=UPI00378B578F